MESIACVVEGDEEEEEVISASSLSTAEGMVGN